MTFEIALVLAILVLTGAMFLSDKFPLDAVALLSMGVLVITGLVTPVQALSGFSNSAVITVLAMFLISGGLARTGVARALGKLILSLGGASEGRLLCVLMAAGAIMSAFMNNVGVAALLLPVTMELAKRSGLPPSRLLLPLASATLLGGMITLIGTPANLLVSEALSAQGLEAFSLFAFAPLGCLVTLAGVLFMVFFGRHLLPGRPTEAGPAVQHDLYGLYQLGERFATFEVPKGSPLIGKSLRASRFGTALHMNVLTIERPGGSLAHPQPHSVLLEGDRLIAQGSLVLWQQLKERQYHRDRVNEEILERLFNCELAVLEATVPEGSVLIGQTLVESNFRQAFSATLLAWTGQELGVLDNSLDRAFAAGDCLLLLVPQGSLGALEESSTFSQVSMLDFKDFFTKKASSGNLGILKPAFPLQQLSISELRLGESLGYQVLGLLREDSLLDLPKVEQALMPGDRLLVYGDPESLHLLSGLQSLTLKSEVPDPRGLESSEAGVAEVVLSPHSPILGKTSRQVHFREKFHLTILAIWSGGRAYRSELRDRPFYLGDAILVYGSRDNIRRLGKEPDFIVLSELAQEPLRTQKAPWALGILLVVLGSVFAGWLPIAIAGLMGGALMMLLGCLTAEEAYRAVELRAILLIAGMLPLGIALENTGAAGFLAELMLGALGDLGPRAVIGALFLSCSLAVLVMPSPVVAVLMAPVALNASLELGFSPQSLLMAVALGSTAIFMSPVSHPANLLVMGPGGYLFKDYIKVGLPLTLIIFVLVVVFLPWVWPPI